MIRALLHSVDQLVDSNGAWSILALDGVLLIPLAFAAFFFPMAAFIGLLTAGVLVAIAAIVMRVAHAHPH